MSQTVKVKDDALKIALAGSEKTGKASAVSLHSDERRLSGGFDMTLLVRHDRSVGLTGPISSLYGTLFGMTVGVCLIDFAIESIKVSDILVIAVCAIYALVTVLFTGWFADDQFTTVRSWPDAFKIFGATACISLLVPIIVPAFVTIAIARRVSARVADRIDHILEE